MSGPPPQDLAIPSMTGKPASWLQRLQPPLLYSAACKRQKQKGLPVLADLLGDDLVILTLAFVPLAAAPGPAVLAVSLLFLSFWAVYEAGYFENDDVSARLEADPRTPAAFDRFRRWSEPRAWIWAVLAGAPGLVAVEASGGWLPALGPADADGTRAPSLTAGLVLWLAALAAMRLLFRVYNHVDKATRVVLYLPLQAVKYGLPALFLPLPAAGAALLVAQALRRWLGYLQYRLTGRRIEILPARVARLGVFALLWLLLLPSQDGAGFLWHGAGIGALLALRAVSQMRGLASGARFIGDAPALHPEKRR